MFHVRQDTYISLLSTFWNWNFAFYQKQGYYNSIGQLCEKIEDNIGLANRLIEKDIRRQRLQLLYIDFLLLFYISLKDFLFICQTIAMGISSVAAMMGLIIRIIRMESGSSSTS